jgi:hypothetical protein
MTSPTRAFARSALLILPIAALLQLLALLGVGPAWPAMVHMTMFGWITGIILVVNYHTVPVFAARDFPLTWLIWLHLAAWLLGIALDGAGQLLGWPLGVSLGLALQLLGALVFVANTLLLFLRGPRRASQPIPPPIAGQSRVDRIGTRATKGAGMALPLALALLLAIRLEWVSGAWTLAAEHLVTLGWLMLMIVGVAYHVLPRFSGRGTRGPGWAGAQLLCHYAALGLIVVAIGAGWGLVFALGGVLMSLALALFAWTIWPTIDFRL